MEEFHISFKLISF